jgi:hypothetical protein
VRPWQWSSSISSRGSEPNSLSSEAQVAEAKIPVLGTVYQRTAFASLFSFQTTLDELPPSEVSGLDKGKGDAKRLTEALGAMIGARAEAAE